MARLIFILIGAGAIALGALWIADRGGTVSVTAAGYEIRTSAVVAVALLVVLIAVVAILTRLLFDGRTKLRTAVSARRARKAYHTLSCGLIAAATADAVEAGEAARQAEELLGPQPLVLLLRAQAADLSGDEALRDNAYRALLDHPETEFLGLRRLSEFSVLRHEDEQALAFALRAHSLRPRSPEAALALLDIRIARSEWAEARSLLDQAVHARLFSPADAQIRADSIAARSGSAVEAPLPS